MKTRKGYGQGWHGESYRHGTVKKNPATEKIDRLNGLMEENYKAAQELKNRHTNLKKQYAQLVKERAIAPASEVRRSKIMSLLDELVKTENRFHARMAEGDSCVCEAEALNRRLATEKRRV